MNPIKSPHQLLLEEAGASLDPSPGLINTPQQMLMRQANVLPRYAPGGAVSTMESPSSLPDVSFDVRSIPSMSGMPGVGYMQTPQGAIARMQLEKELENKARLRAGVSGMGMKLPGQENVKLMPGQMDIGANLPMGPGNFDISANRSINPVPGKGHMQGVNARYTIPFAPGGFVQNLSPADMQASVIVNGNTPQNFAGGSLVKNIGTQAAFSLPFMTEDAKEIAQDIKNKKYKEAAAKTAGVGYSAFAPWNPLAALISGMTYSPEVGDATLDAYKQKQAEHEAEVSARAQALSPVFKWNKPATLDEMQQSVLGYPNIPLPKVK
jgi:hypothetical protein